MWGGGSPAADLADVSRLWAAAGQRDGLDVLVEDGGRGQADHGQAVKWRAVVGTVTDDVSDVDALLGAFLHGEVMLPEMCDGLVRSVRTEEERLRFTELK